MYKAEILSRYDGHPLGAALANLAAASDDKILYRMYIAAKSMLMLLEYQGEISKDETRILDDHIEMYVNTYQPGNGQKVCS